MVRQVRPGTSMVEFRRELESQSVTLVDFFAEWCGPCKAIAPQVEQLSQLHPHVTFLKVDVDQCPDISGASNIAAMPTFILYSRGAEVGRVTGANPGKIKELLQRATSMAASSPMPVGSCAYGNCPVQPMAMPGTDFRTYNAGMPFVGQPMWGM